MFGLFRKKPAQQTAQNASLLPLATDLADESLIAAIHGVFSNQKPVVAALFLVALENLPVYFSVFCTAAREEGKYPPTMDGMVDFLRRAYDEHRGSSDFDEVNRRRWFYLYTAALLNIAHARARARPALWESVADIWVLLLDGARCLRDTLDGTSLWKPDEIEFFDNVASADGGEQYVESLLLPAEIRYHAKLTAWRERDLPPEIKAELDRMDNLMRGTEP
jgi:hypothetical protein